MGCADSTARMMALLRLIHKLIYPGRAPRFPSHRSHWTAARH